MRWHAGRCGRCGRGSVQFHVLHGQHGNMLVPTPLCRNLVLLGFYLLCLGRFAMLGVTDGDAVRSERASGLVVLDGRASRPTNRRDNHAMHRSRDYCGS